MTFAPAMTWMHLLPRDVAYRCDSGPAGLRDMLPRDATGEKVVAVTWEETPGNGPDPAPLHGLVAINARDLDVEALRAAGFAYIRRLAILPSLARSRWFVPLDSAATSSAGLCLYTPARPMARLMTLTARLAMRAHIPLWYRDSVCIALRSPPPLELALAELFPGESLRLALSAGAPEPARNRKASCAVLDMRGRIRAFGKIASSPLARRLLGHEAEVLKTLATMNGCGERAPRLLYAGEIDGTYVAIQAPLAGRACGTRLTPPHHAFLRSLRTGDCRPAALAPLVQSLPERLSSLPEPRPDLADALEREMPALQEMSLPLAVVHGDFSPWNLRQHAGVIAAFDWEYGQPGGLPMLDAFHHTLQVGYLLENWSLERAAEQLEMACARSDLALTPRQGRALQIVYLLDVLARLLAEGYPASDPMLDWHCQLLRRLTPARKEAVVA